MRSLRLHIISIATVILPIYLLAGEFDIQWYSLYDISATSQDYIEGMAVDPMGWYVIASRDQYNNVYLSKVDIHTGTLVATALIDSNSIPVSVAVDSQGNYLMLTSYSKLFKISNNLDNILWIREFSFSAKKIMVDNDNGYIIVGTSGTNPANIIVRKLEPIYGYSIWERTYTNSYNFYHNVYVHDIVSDSQFLYIVGRGTRYSSERAYLLKVEKETGDSSYLRIYNNYTFRHLTISKNYLFASSDGGRDTLFRIDANSGNSRLLGVFININDVETTPDSNVLILDDARDNLIKVDSLYGDTLNVMNLNSNNNKLLKVDYEGSYVVSGITTDGRVFILRIFGYDLVSPNIDSLIQLEDDYDSPYGPYQVWAKAYDIKGEVRTVRLFWKRESFPAFLDTVMYSASSDWWYGFIPQQTPPDDSVRIYYFIYAEDSMGNYSLSDTLSFWIVNRTVSREESNTYLQIIINGMYTAKLYRFNDVLEVFTLTGRRIFYKRFPTNKFRTVFINLKPGVYILKSGIFRKTIIVK